MTRYQRQIILPQVGESGQKALMKSRVLLVGAGGLGLPCAQSLVAAGVGQLTLVDDDRVSLSNLQRQTLFGEKDLGRPKIEVALERLRLQNSDVLIEGHQERLRPQNARALIAGHDLIIDGSDNFATKFLINDACLLEKKPWIYGSVSRFEGQLATFFADEAGCCYRCLYEKMPVSKIENCAEQGVLGAVTAIIGHFQALEALKMLMSLRGGGEGISPQTGYLRVFDLISLEQRNFLIPKKKKCKCISGTSIDLHEEAEFCILSLEKTWRDFDEDLREKLLFDVRSPAEFEKGHHERGRLWGAECLKDFRTEPIYLYCFSGQRARAKCLELRKKGFSAFYLRDGDWQGHQRSEPGEIELTNTELAAETP